MFIEWAVKFLLISAFISLSVRFTASTSFLKCTINSKWYTYKRDHSFVFIQKTTIHFHIPHSHSLHLVRMNHRFHMLLLRVHWNKIHTVQIFPYRINRYLWTGDIWMLSMSMCGRWFICHARDDCLILYLLVLTTKHDNLGSSLIHTYTHTLSHALTLSHSLFLLRAHFSNRIDVVKCLTSKKNGTNNDDNNYSYKSEQLTVTLSL